MSVISDAQFMLNASRGFFRGSFKTDNKRYSGFGSAPQARVDRRKECQLKAEEVLDTLHKACSGDPVQQYKFLQPRPKEERAGDCGQYTQAAMFSGYEIHIPNIWSAYTTGRIHHYFLVLAGTSNLPPTKVASFLLFSQSDYCCCDPWLNIACKMGDYPQQVRLKIMQWQVQGKQIATNKGLWLTASRWSLNFLRSEVRFHRITDDAGHWIDGQPP